MICKFDLWPPFGAFERPRIFPFLDLTGFPSSFDVFGYARNDESFVENLSKRTWVLTLHRFTRQKGLSMGLYTIYHNLVAAFSAGSSLGAGLVFDVRILPVLSDALSAAGRSRPKRW